jgi:hypothetical protein
MRFGEINMSMKLYNYTTNHIFENGKNTAAAASVSSSASSASSTATTTNITSATAEVGCNNNNNQMNSIYELLRMQPIHVII